MGRHSRRGPAKGEIADISTRRQAGAAGPADASGGPSLSAPDGTPTRGIPRSGDDTPVRGTPERRAPQVRGGHPEHREAGGGWGELNSRAGAAGTGTAEAFVPRQRRRAQAPGGPRQEYVEAFDDQDDDVTAFTAFTGSTPRQGSGAGTTRRPYPAATATPETGTETGTETEPVGPEVAPSGRTRGTKGRAFTGIAAAAVTTVLAVIVAGQVTDDQDTSGTRTRATADRGGDGSASRGNGRTTPSAVPGVAPLTYNQKIAVKYPLAARLKGSGKFETVPGTAKAPGKGKKYTYRVDMERGLDLDGALFAEAVQKTLNDDRSWAHEGARTFERVDSGKADFVVTLASPGTSAAWCAKSDLDTAQQNVSCNSYRTQRVIINAYRWAQGSKTYGNEIHSYRQMLINHEVGHRLGYSHVTCDKDGELAPVMQQQTKFLDHDGIHCLPNAWPYPKG